jgi:hypothetical protein
MSSNSSSLLGFGHFAVVGVGMFLTVTISHGDDDDRLLGRVLGIGRREILVTHPLARPAARRVQNGERLTP